MITARSPLFSERIYYEVFQREVTMTDSQTKLSTLQHTSPMNTLIKLLSLTLLLSLNACLTYTSPIGDLPDAGELNEAGFRGETEFFRIEQDHKDRLDDLMQKRARRIAGARAQDYRIGVGDLIEIQVFDVEELNRRVRVRPTGDISLPLVGLVRAAGLSEEELQITLAKRMNSFMHSPQPQVFIAEYASQKVSVIGEVANPGTYSLSRNDYSLIEILSEAGGRTNLASGMVILIPADEAKQDKILQRTRLRGRDRAILKTPPKEQNDSANLQQLASQSNAGIEVDFSRLVGSANSAPLGIPLQAGDTIIIPEAGNVKVDGEVKRPGSYTLDSRTTLLGAIASAGGLTFSADSDDVEVIRDLGNGEKALLKVELDSLSSDTSKDIRLRDGDVVRVTSAPVRFAIRQVVDGFTGLMSFGLSGNVGP